MAEIAALIATEALPEIAATAGAEAGGSAILPEIAGIDALTQAGMPSGPELTLPDFITPEPAPSYEPYLMEAPTFGAPMASLEETSAAIDAAEGQGGIKDLMKDPMKKLDAYIKTNPYKSMLMAMSLGSMMNRQKGYSVPGYSGPQTLNRYRWAAAQGGIASVAPPGYDMVVGETPMYARGGVSDLGSYSDGGRMLKGPGDGMSDSIPGVIAGKRPARLADSEFVVPADVVSHLGNGSTDAGAKQLYKMMDRVRVARTGNKKQGRQINPRRFMPA